MADQPKWTAATHIRQWEGIGPEPWTLHGRQFLFKGVLVRAQVEDGVVRLINSYGETVTFFMWR